MSYTNLLYHIVFSTKERRPFLTPDRLPRICEYIGGIIRQRGGQMLAVGGAPDHLHLAAVSKASVAISDFLREIKSGSSGWIHETFADLRAFRWQDGYAAFTVSSSVMPDVVRYVRAQEQRHKKMSFHEELVALLERHGIEYDERYIWR